MSRAIQRPHEHALITLAFKNARATVGLHGGHRRAFALCHCPELDVIRRQMAAPTKHRRVIHRPASRPRKRPAFQLTFRAFTKPRSRPKGGVGVSTPTGICYFHDLRGKRATRALREMTLLAEVTCAGGHTTRLRMIHPTVPLTFRRVRRDGSSVSNRSASLQLEAWWLASACPTDLPTQGPSESGGRGERHGAGGTANPRLESTRIGHSGCVWDARVF